ncbi:hypothetical protein KCU77_g4059, partial [Aureobasidium melanogenum]
MPPIRTEKSHIKSNDKKRPSLHNMYVSISRRKPFTGSRWNCQASLLGCSYQNSDPKQFGLSDLDFVKIQGIIEGDLSVDVTEDEKDEDGKDWCLVWYMFDSDQLGHVYDDVSFQSAVQDHRRAHKHIVQLYIVESKGKCDRARYRHHADTCPQMHALEQPLEQPKL